MRDLRDADRERFRLVCLDLKLRVLACEESSVGLLDATLVHPREVFRTALLCGAASVALIHNHPSGCPEPSAEDRALTERLVAAGRIMGVEVVDHVIIGASGFVSFSERGWL